MSAGWAAKRFWKAATVAEAPGGWTVHLDARPLRTPAKAPLIVPSAALAAAIAAEWDAQDKIVDPRSMPLTRAANAAIDKVAPQFDEVAELIAAYGGTDLLCYRAPEPPELIARQAEGWDPLLSWAAETLGAPLAFGQGVVHVPQPEASLAALTARVRACTNFELAALHDLVGMSGSLILGLAVALGRLDPDTAWRLSRIDEDWQAEQWGVDEEAAEQVAHKQRAFLDADRFWRLCRAE